MYHAYAGYCSATKGEQVFIQIAFNFSIDPYEAHVGMLRDAQHLWPKAEGFSQHQVHLMTIPDEWLRPRVLRHGPWVFPENYRVVTRHGPSWLS